MSSNVNKSTSFVEKYQQVRIFLRIFLLDGNKTIDDFKRFGIKESTYRQTIAKLKPYLRGYGIELRQKNGKKSLQLPADMFRFGYNYLSNSYAMSSDFKKKTGRIALLMQILNQADGRLSKENILNKVANETCADTDSFIRTLDDMEEYGLVDKINDGKLCEYVLREDIFQVITESVPESFLDMIALCRNLAAPYICGNMLMETALEYFKESGMLDEYESPFIIKGSYFCQILDDEVLWNILDAARKGKSVKLEYGRGKKVKEILPLKLVTDNNLGKRYLFGKGDKKFEMLRLDKIKNVQLGEKRFQHSDYAEEFEKRTRYSFNGITLTENEPVEITLKFDECLRNSIVRLFKEHVIYDEKHIATVKVNTAAEIKPWLMRNIGLVSVVDSNCGFAEIMAAEYKQWEDLYADIQ